MGVGAHIHRVIRIEGGGADVIKKAPGADQSLSATGQVANDGQAITENAPA